MENFSHASTMFGYPMSYKIGPRTSFPCLMKWFSILFYIESANSLMIQSRYHYLWPIYFMDGISMNELLIQTPFISPSQKMRLNVFMILAIIYSLSHERIKELFEGNNLPRVSLQNLSSSTHQNILHYIQEFEKEYHDDTPNLCLWWKVWLLLECPPHANMLIWKQEGARRL